MERPEQRDFNFLPLATRADLEKLYAAQTMLVACRELRGIPVGEGEKNLGRLRLRLAESVQ